MQSLVVAYLSKRDIRSEFVLDRITNKTVAVAFVDHTRRLKVMMPWSAYLQVLQ